MPVTLRDPLALTIGLAALSLLAGPPLLAADASAASLRAEVPVESFTLDNGLTFLLVRRPELATVAGGWVAKVGAANEHPGITGISHFFEHMMFKGSMKIGTKDIRRDLAIIEEQEKLQERMRAIYRDQRRRYRLGEIDDPFAAANRPPELVELESQFQKLVDEQRALMVKDEVDRIYTAAGAVGMNASTFADQTIYFINVPANKLELWFWMESERLYEPVFREFYSERDVVHEERRLRTESTPTGLFDEQLASMIWQSHPYHWPVIGWPSDLRSYSLAQAKEYFATYYAPNNLLVALVGNFDPAEVKALAHRYFDRIPRGKVEPPDVVTLEMPQVAEKRMNAECDCQPQVDVEYHSVPFEHRDSYALEILAGVLNGRSGRLYESMVLGKEIAVSASASQGSQKWAGTFGFIAQTKGDAAPAALEAVWYEEVARLQNEPVPAAELEKVKNQVLADSFRRLEDPFFLMVQLLYYEGQGDWRYLNTNAARLLAVTAEDLQRVANTYLTRENRTVAIYTRKAGAVAEEVPSELAALPPEVQQGVKAQLGQIAAAKDAGKLEQFLAGLGQQKSQAPAEYQPVIEILERAARARLTELAALATQGGKS
jgi:predicted Zn-dependent peptidase